MKKLEMIVCTTAILSIAAAFAQTKISNENSRRAKTPAAGGRIVAIEQFPRLGRPTVMRAPVVEGPSQIGKVASKQRPWIVLETKYTTYQKWVDELTFTWHVLLETKTATYRDKDDKIPPYSYYTESVTYHNIPRGQHAASVCLHPSNLERFGEPRAVGLVITSGGKVIAGDCESQIHGITSHPKDISLAFWNQYEIMNKKDHDGGPLIERRKGLVDRSKTIWALVNPEDYEQTAK